MCTGMQLNDVESADDDADEDESSEDDDERDEVEYFVDNDEYSFEMPVVGRSLDSFGDENK